MKTGILLLSALVTSMCFLPGSVIASTSDMETSTQSFSVRLGTTRVIYDPDSNGTTLSVVNPQNYPILLQSEVLGEDMKSKAPFIVTPPLMRLDAFQQSRLRIVRTGGNFAEDRETMQWICAKGIPPKADDAWANTEKKNQSAKNKVTMNVQLSINNCIKLLVRPSSVKGTPSAIAQNVKWTKEGSKLKGKNDSPFYINLTSLSLGNKSISDTHYIAPYSSYLYDIKGLNNSNQVSWKIINDYGGESPEYKKTIK
ncbi:fimbria/pilus periplasmic chaperone [Enterobacter chuandaensis]